MNKKEISTLVNLLAKLKTEGLEMPNMPSVVWLAINKLVPLPAVEVLITRSGEEFRLVYRKDQYWDGWHIPGGFYSLKNRSKKVVIESRERNLESL